MLSFDIVMCTTGSRPKLLRQSLRSLHENASKWAAHSLTLVMDGCSVMDVCKQAGVVPNRIIINPERQGASRSRNIGASSTPKYLRKDAVCFFDDDVYCCPRWDMFKFKPDAVWSGHAHPYNHPYQVVDSSVPAKQTSVISTVHMIIPWGIWDDVGFFAEPGGPGGSEDVDWCARAGKKDYTLGITQPQSVLHTGLGSTSGKKLIGWESVMEHNRNLEATYSLIGRVVYA